MMRKSKSEKHYSSEKRDFFNKEKQERESKGLGFSPKIAQGKWANSDEKINAMFKYVDSSTPTRYESNNLGIDEIG
jgi:hypothetical protein